MYHTTTLSQTKFDTHFCHELLSNVLTLQRTAVPNHSNLF